MRTQVAKKYAPDTEVICVSTEIQPNFETINWATADKLQKGERLKISETEYIGGILAIKPVGKKHFHPHQKFASLRSFIPLDTITFTQNDVGRKIEIRGLHFLSQSNPWGSDSYTRVNPRSTKTYTIVRVNERSLSLDFSTKVTDRSVRLAFSTNAQRNANPSIRFK